MERVGPNVFKPAFEEEIANPYWVISALLFAKCGIVNRTFIHICSMWLVIMDIQNH